MTQFLPQPLLSLFAAREELPYLPPPQPLSHEKPTQGYTGIGEFIKFFETEEPPAPAPYVTRDERRQIKKKAKAEVLAYKVEQEIAIWNPTCNPKATTDPHKTLFVGRIHYDVSEKKLRRKFDVHGPIKKIIMVQDKLTHKFRGYAFVEFENERDALVAYNKCDGKKIGGRRIVVDMERGRTDKSWIPRRLGGGLGGTRRGGEQENTKISGREGDLNAYEPSVEHKERRRGQDRSRTISRDRVRKADNDFEKRRDRKSERRPNSRDRVTRASRDLDRKESRRRTRDDSREKHKSRRRSRSRSVDRKRRRSHSKDTNEDRKRDKKDKDRELSNQDRYSKRDKGRTSTSRDQYKSKDRSRKQSEASTMIKPDPEPGGLAQVKIKEEVQDHEMGEIEIENGDDGHYFFYGAVKHEQDD